MLDLIWPTILEQSGLPKQPVKSKVQCLNANGITQASYLDITPYSPTCKSSAKKKNRSFYRAYKRKEGYIPGGERKDLE